MRHRVVAAALCAALVFLVGCTHQGPRPDPTIEKPREDGCIPVSLKDRAMAEGKLLPERILIIGITPLEDGERWMVVRGPEWDFDDWQPWERESIAFGAQCAGAVGLQ